MTTDDSLSPVARERLQDRVYGELRRALINGTFAAGDTLRLVDLAERLGTSTMPVREALARLVSEQALESLPNRSVRVPPISLARLDDLARARILIEGELVALALPRLGPADFAELCRINDACDAVFAEHGRDVGPVTSEFNRMFHFHIYRAAASPVLLPVVESLWLQSGAVIRQAAQLHDEDGGIAANDHHRALTAALERGDGETARRELARDIGRSFALVARRLAAVVAEAG